MDRKIQKSKWKNKSLWSIIGLLCLVSFALLFIIKGQESHLSIDFSQLQFGEVIYDDFQEITVSNGVLEPEKSVWINVNDGGHVQEIFAEEGQTVKAGDVLMLLSNERITLDLMQRETQMVEQINNMRNIRITLNQNQRSTEDQLVDFTQQLNLSDHQHNINTTLVKKNAISQEEFYQSKANKTYLEQKVHILKNRIKSDSTYRRKQIERIDHSITLMNRNLSIIRNKLKELTITAPISGQLNYFDYEVGQMITANQNIGRVDKTDRYVLRTQIDQHYIERITEGIQAKIRVNNTSYTLRIHKIFPRIENGQFTVLMEFTDTPPESIRRGQSFQVQIELSAQRKSILIPKGGHYQSSGGQYVYVLSPDGTQARKRNVKFGNKNPKYYEIKSGLEVGEKIITSNYELFKTNNLLTIQQ